MLRKWIEKFRGSGEAAVTIPSMDGALRPNSLIEAAKVVWTASEGVVGNLATDGRRHFFSCGHDLYALEDASGAEPELVTRFDAPISAVAAHADGFVAVGLAGKGVLVRAPDGALRSIGLEEKSSRCCVAMAFLDAGTLVVANGSETNRPAQWHRDLMQKNSTGSIWRCDVSGNTVARLAQNLGYPSGLVVTRAGSLIVSESWRHQLLAFENATAAAPSVLLEDLPGYPGAIAPASDGGYWLAIFAPRRQIIEFVLRERRYCEEMIATIDEQYWVAPSLKSGINYFEPVQNGSVRHLGLVKPWAPTRSYGLVVKLDEGFNPQASYHSRADGHRHGITSVSERGDTLLMTCAATNQLLALNPTLTEG